MNRVQRQITVMMMTKTNQYKRIANVIYENDVPIIKLKQNFIDVELMNETTVDYMNRYFKMNPTLFETLKNENVQLNLF